MDEWEPVEVNHDYHAVWTIELAELMDSGFDPFGDEAWDTLEWFDDATRERFEKKFVLRYKHYEIGETPALRWRDDLTARMAEVTRKYYPWYKWLSDDGNPLLVGDEWGKRRDVFSDFPATQLSPSEEDYASNATDNQYEHRSTGDMLETLAKLRSVGDVDSLMLDECVSLFSWTDSSPSLGGFSW